MGPLEAVEGAEGAADATPRFGATQGGLSVPQVDLLQPLIFRLLAADRSLFAPNRVDEFSIGNPGAYLPSGSFETNPRIESQVARLKIQYAERPVKVSFRESIDRTQTVHETEAARSIRREQMGDPVLSQHPLILILSDDVRHEDSTLRHQTELVRTSAEHHDGGLNQLLIERPLNGKN